MSKRQFYKQCIKFAFTGGWGIADIVSFGIGAIGGLVVWIWKPAGEIMNILIWAIPLAIFLAIFIARLVLAPYRIFKDIEKSRDELLNVSQKNGIVVLKHPPELTIGIGQINFGISGDSGYPLTEANGTKLRWVRLGIGFSGNVRIETLELIISGKQPIPAFEWKSGQGAFYFYFQIPDWVRAGDNRTIQVVAFAEGIKWGSEERSIKFPEK